MRRPRPSARVRANRKNAQASTGPRTSEGKARAARNGVVHGLASIGAGRSPVARVEELALRLVIDAADRFFGDGGALEAAARRFAEAQVHVLDVRAARRRFWARLVDGRQELDALVEELRRDLQEFGPAPRLLRRMVEGYAARNARRKDPLKNLDAMQKYECRALARRKRAAREFVDVLAQGACLPVST